jgi:hypothetical protein
MSTRRPRRPAIARAALAGFCFPSDVILLAVRWYLRFALPDRDPVELLAERGIEVAPVTVYRWVLHFTPLLTDAARPCRHAVGTCWQVAETYVKVAGQWRYADVRSTRSARSLMCSSRRDVTPSQPGGSMRGLKQDRSARVIIAGHAFVRNVRRGHDELGIQAPASRRVAAAFDELALAM